MRIPVVPSSKLSGARPRIRWGALFDQLIAELPSLSGARQH